MAYDISVKIKAINLRKSGFSIKEIAKILNIAQSSSSHWLRNITISDQGKSRMAKNKETNRYKMSLKWEQKRSEFDKYYKNKAEKIVKRIELTDITCQILCSLLYWAEGSKHINHIAFTNSDPEMIKAFMTLFRKSFKLSEEKFHASLHLHEYHDFKEMLSFWSDITNIPIARFIKPYLKPHTAIRKHDDYKGCITIRYYDYKIARELTAIYNALADVI